jgi:hypothetical protein
MHVVSSTRASFSSIDQVLADFVFADFASGAMPYAYRQLLHNVPPLADLVPERATVARRADATTTGDWVLEGEGWRARIEGGIGRFTAMVHVIAVDPDLAMAVATEMQDRCPVPEETIGVHVTVWYGPGSHRVRHVSSSPWADIARNYPPDVRSVLDQLVALRPTEDDGRVIVLHGEPGTGKTTFIRSLLWEWRSWTRADVVDDGSKLLHDPAYFGEVAAEQHGDRWQVIVIEDAGDLVDDTLYGGDLSRLLNASDGIVGMGTRTLFVLTTNEPIYTPQKALLRPGRCLAKIELRSFSRREALGWLDAPKGVPAGGLTLAQLFDRTKETTMITNERAPEVHGTYL